MVVRRPDAMRLSDKLKLILISNTYGLDADGKKVAFPQCGPALADHYKECDVVWLLPYAQFADMTEAYKKLKGIFKPLGVSLAFLHKESKPAKVLEKTDGGLYIPGGEYMGIKSLLAQVRFGRGY